MNVFQSIMGFNNPSTIGQLGKVGLRLEFSNNEEMFRFIDTNKELHSFVKPMPESSKNIEAKSHLKQVIDKAQNPDLNPETDVVLVPLNQIFTDHANFQNRETDFSSESVERILSSIREGSFRWAIFDPITLYRNPTDAGLYILSGHSRTAAFRMASKDQLSAEGRKFDSIPAKIFTGSLEEARELARNSNSLSTRETEIERANFYRSKRLGGMPAKEIREMANRYEGKNAGFILNLSHLNQEGKTWQSLKLILAGTESENTRTIKEIADWIGEARRKFPNLSNGHENEIYEWLMAGAFTKLKSKRIFFERLGIAISKASQFGQMDERLNIENRSGKSNLEVEMDEKVEAARREYDEAEKQLREKRKEFVARGADPVRLDALLVEYQASVNGALRRLNELVKLRDSAKEGAKNQMSLFGLGEIGINDFWGLLVGENEGIGSIKKHNKPYNFDIDKTFIINGLRGVKIPTESQAVLSELKIRRSKKKFHDQPVKDPVDSELVFRKIFDPNLIELQEAVYVLYLDAKGEVVGYVQHSKGGIISAPIDLRLILAPALLTGALFLIVCHNHPSGNTRHSDSDVKFSRSLSIACNTLDLTLLGSYILTKDQFVEVPF